MRWSWIAAGFILIALIGIGSSRERPRHPPLPTVSVPLGEPVIQKPAEVAAPPDTLFWKPLGGSASASERSGAAALSGTDLPEDSDDGPGLAGSPPVERPAPAAAGKKDLPMPATRVVETSRPPAEEPPARSAYEILKAQFLDAQLRAARMQADGTARKQAIAVMKSALQRCYQQALAYAPGLSGPFRVEVTLAPSDWAGLGVLENTAFVSRGREDPRMGKCLTLALHWVRVPLPSRRMRLGVTEWLSPQEDLTEGESTADEEGEEEEPAADED